VNTKKRRLPLFAGVLALSLVAAACGSDDNSSSDTTAAASATTAGSSETTAGGTETTAGSSDTTTAGGADINWDELSGELNGSGATFPKAFYDEMIANLAEKAPNLTINYAGGGSGKGRSDLQAKVVDFAGTDGVVKDADKAGYKGGEFVYVPTVIAPITMSYNLPDVKDLKLSPDTIAKIFQLQIKNWNDAAIAADNEGVDLPDTPIVVARRADGSGTTENFSKFLDAASGKDGSGVWTLGAASELEWPAGTQAGDGNSGVAQIVKSTPGAIGYVDYSDAKAAGLSFAEVKNKAGKFVAPSLEGTTAAAENATINPDLTFFLGWADGDEAYPIAAQTWIIAYTKQDDAKKAEAIRAMLTYMLTDGQQAAPDIDYAPLPESLQQQAMENIAKIGG
jgi:phosphate transport system substrate-binding protein